jgi:GNAT superfamily N-acetyltransferase
MTPDATDPIVVRPATADRWADVVTILGGDGDRGCWCQSWRGSDASFGRAPQGGNRERLRAQIEDGAFAPGLVAYIDEEPVGWLGFGPRAAMPRLVNSRTMPALDDLPVWSIGCFRIRVGYRRRGVARALLAAAV